MSNLTTTVTGNLVHAFLNLTALNLLDVQFKIKWCTKLPLLIQYFKYNPVTKVFVMQSLITILFGELCVSVTFNTWNVHNTTTQVHITDCGAGLNYQNPNKTSIVQYRELSVSVPNSKECDSRGSWFDRSWHITVLFIFSEVTLCDPHKFTSDTMTNCLTLKYSIFIHQIQIVFCPLWQYGMGLYLIDGVRVE